MTVCDTRAMSTAVRRVALGYRKAFCKPQPTRLLEDDSCRPALRHPDVPTLLRLPWGLFVVIEGDGRKTWLQQVTLRHRR